MKKWILEICAFASGFSVMVLEMAGIRVIAPYYGMSINVMTMLIGIVLGGLSLGYWYGGKLADRNPKYSKLSNFFFIVGVYLLLISFLKDVLMYSLNILFSKSLILSSFSAILVLFFPPSLFFGFVTPYTVKLRLNSLLNTGAKVGNLYAVSTLGSIFGTFLSGFYLIPVIGSTRIFILIATICFIVSWLVFRNISVKVLLAIFVSFILLSFFQRYQSLLNKAGLIQLDSRYGDVFIYTKKNTDNIAEAKYLISGAYGAQAIKYDKQKNNDFINIAILILDFWKTKPKEILILGGGVYVLSDEISKKFVNSSIDIIELDKSISDAGKLYFNHRDNFKVKTIIEDARVYLNLNTKKYDLIINDTFVDLYPPFHLLTKEAVEKIHNSLTDSGIYILNLTSASEGEAGILYRAVGKTLKSVFTNVYFMPVNKNLNNKISQNIIIIAEKGKEKKFPGLSNVIDDQKIKILTDDLAPVEKYLLPVTFKKPQFPTSQYIIITKLKVLANLSGIKHFLDF